MKNTRLLLPTLLIHVLTFLSCQVNDNKYFDEKVKLIDEKVEQIKKDSTITIRKFINEDTTLVLRTKGYINYGSGKVSYYSRNDTIIKISYSGSNSFGSGYTNEYYFRNNQLIFVYKWRAVAFEGKNESMATEYYIEHQKLIKTEKGETNRNDEKELFAEVQVFIDLLKIN